MEIHLIAVAASLAAAASLTVSAQSIPPSSAVTLVWNPSQSAGVTGYKIYQGGISGNYTNTLNVGNATNATIGGLRTNATYYFAATAYDGNGLESEKSNEVGYTMPPTNARALLRLVAGPAKQLRLSGTGPVGYQYQVLTSADLANWSAAGRLTVALDGQFLFTNTSLATNAASFFRLKQTFP